VQVLAYPYRLKWVNDLQLVAAVCLVLLAVLNSASSAFQSVGFDAGENSALQVCVLVDARANSY
jgi:hypothetical protein